MWRGASIDPKVSNCWFKAVKEFTAQPVVQDGTVKWQQRKAKMVGNLTSSKPISSVTAPPGRTATCKRLITNLYPGGQLSTNMYWIWLQLLSTAASSLLQAQPQTPLNKSVHNYWISLTHNWDHFLHTWFCTIKEVKASTRQYRYSHSIQQSSHWSNNAETDEESVQMMLCAWEIWSV